MSLAPPGDRVRRPLDRLGSIKLKLGVLVTASVGAAATLTVVGQMLGVRARFSIPVAVLVALVLTQLLARGMTSPLREMTAAARAMARGDYSRRVRATSGDEVGELARAFNTMAADLESVDRQRRELVANVSHELRTPVSALHAVLENLVDGVAHPDETTLRTALRQTERLGRLVGDLLDLSRVDAGITSLHLEPVALRTLLEQAVGEARLTDRPVLYDVAVEPEDLTVTADPARLHQLVANLLDNASRHSPVGGRVRVHARHHDEATLLEVSDEGPGIRPADRARVFERFGTGQSPGGLGSHDGGDPDGGTGLGLAIARWVTALHDGHIEVAEPDPPGRGCLIRARLPHRSPEPAPG